jgi:hypothetical protein
MMKTVEGWLGRSWMDWLEDKKKSTSAFKVETMAVNVGLGRMYDAVYRPQSAIVHANDALQHLHVGNAPMTIDAHLGGDIERANGPLRLANAICGHAADAVNDRFGLGFYVPLKELAAAAQALPSDEALGY